MSEMPVQYRRIGCVLCDNVMGPLRSPDRIDLRVVPCGHCEQVGGVVDLPIPGTWPTEVYVLDDVLRDRGLELVLMHDDDD